MLSFTDFQDIINEFSQEYTNKYNTYSEQIIYDYIKHLTPPELAKILMRLQKKKNPQHTNLPAPVHFQIEISQILKEKEESEKQVKQVKLDGTNCHLCNKTGLIQAARKNDDLSDPLSYNNFFFCYCLHGRNKRAEIIDPDEWPPVGEWTNAVSQQHSTLHNLIKQKFDGDYSKYRTAYTDALFKTNHGIATRDEQKVLEEKKEKNAHKDQIGHCQSVGNVLKGSGINS